MEAIFFGSGLNLVKAFHAELALECINFRREWNGRTEDLKRLECEEGYVQIIAC